MIQKTWLKDPLPPVLSLPFKERDREGGSGPIGQSF